MSTTVNTYDNRFGHCRFEDIAEVQKCSLVVSEENIFFVTVQEHGFTYHVLLERERGGGGQKKRWGQVKVRKVKFGKDLWHS